MHPHLAEFIKRTIGQRRLSPGLHFFKGNHSHETPISQLGTFVRKPRCANGRSQGQLTISRRIVKRREAIESAVLPCVPPPNKATCPQSPIVRYVPVFVNTTLDVEAFAPLKIDTCYKTRYICNMVAETHVRITDAALKLLLARGIQKMSLADVAFEAGVTRVTVYRYCGDKKGLIGLVFQRIVSFFRKAAEGADTDSIEAIDGRLQELGRELALLPKEHLLARFEEIKRVYPEVYAEFRANQREAVDRIFYRVLAAATREQSLREEVNLEVLRAIFWASAVGLIENPALISANVSLAEIFTTVSEVFRHGVLKERAKESDDNAV
jgi:AcrR family transcriptional regulator